MIAKLKLKSRFMTRPLGEKLTAVNDAKKDGIEDDEDWMKAQKDFHDQSMLGTPPGLYWKQGLKHIAVGPTPDFRSDESKIGKTYYTSIGNEDIKK